MGFERDARAPSKVWDSRHRVWMAISNCKKKHDGTAVLKFCLGIKKYIYFL